MNQKKDDGAMVALLRDDEVPAPPIPGQSVTGKVVNIQNNKILVEIDGTYLGIIAGREAADGFDTAKNMVEGDEVTAHIVEEENSDGYYVLSLRKSSREKAWKHLAEMVTSGETVEVPIKEANKGGLMTEFNGIRAFIPVSQLAPEHYPRVNGANSSEILSRLKKYIGERFVVQVIAAEQEEKKLIFSEKAGLSKKRAIEIKKLNVGDTIKGKVSGVVNFGIFLMFGEGLEGLVHLSEIAWGRVTDAASFARVGEEKEAVIIAIEPDKISLSIKRLTPDPWLSNIEKFSVDDVVEGTVEKITPFGALIKIADEVSGLLHSSEFSKEDDTKLEIGDEVKAKIIEINPGEHRIALSIKDLPTDKPKKKKAAVKKEAEEEEKEEKPKKKAAKKDSEKK